MPGQAEKSAAEYSVGNSTENILLDAVGATPHLDYSYEVETRSLWITMAPKPYPRLTEEMTASFGKLASFIRHRWGAAQPSLDQPIKFVVLRSSTPAVFSTGGDLPSIIRWVEARDSDSLSTYFRNGTRCFHDLADGFGSSIVTVAAVSGKAYGGGFEAARACDFIVADETARFGFPEWRFGLFPGNGAFSLIGTRHDEALLRRLVLDGDYINGREAHALGIVDRIGPKGGADALARELVAGLLPRHAACLALRRSMQRIRGLSLPTMLEETDRYLSAVLQSADLAVMKHLVAAQERILSRGSA